MRFIAILLFYYIGIMGGGIKAKCHRTIYPLHKPK